MAVFSNGPISLAQGHSQVAHHIIYNKEKGSKHADGLERVGPYKCFDASPAGVKPYQADHAHHGNTKGNTMGLKHKSLQDDANHIEAHGRPRHL